MGDAAEMYDEQYAGYYDGEDDFEYADWERKTKSCRYCGQGGLHWVMTDRYGWRMAHESGNLHNCCAKRREYLQHHPHPSHG